MKNLSIVPPTASPATNPQKGIVAEQPVIRSLGVISEYDADNNEFVPATVPASSFGKKKAPADQEKPASPVAESHAKWKADQQAKKAKAEQAKMEKQTQKQALAKDLLRNGDLVGASKALGMSPQELFLYTQNAVLSVPNKEAELTPEQKKQQDEETYRRARDAKLQDLENWKYEQTATNWIREHIDPVLDTKAFPLISQSEVPKVKRAVYEYLNKHYMDTSERDSDGKIIKPGEVLDVKDVLETIEAQYEEAAAASLEKLRSVEKFAKYFKKERKAAEAALQEEELTEDTQEEEPQSEEVEPEFKPLDYSVSRLRNRDKGQQVEETSVELRRNNSVPKNKPFGLMSLREKQDYLRSINK